MTIPANTISIIVATISTSLILWNMHITDLKEQQRLSDDRVLVKERQDNVIKYLSETKEFIKNHEQQHKEEHGVAKIELELIRTEIDTKLAETALMIRSYEDNRQRIHDAAFPPRHLLNQVRDIQNCIITSKICPDYRMHSDE